MTFYQIYNKIVLLPNEQQGGDRVKGYLNLKLKGAIAEKGLTQGKVADATGMNLVTLNRKINGKLIFEEPEMQKIADFLDKNVMEIFFTNKVTN